MSRFVKHHADRAGKPERRDKAETLVRRLAFHFDTLRAQFPNRRANIVAHKRHLMGTGSAARSARRMDSNFGRRQSEDQPAVPRI